MRITTLWIADVRQPSDVMRDKGGENCDELCVTGNSTHVLPVHDINYLSLPATVFVDLIKFSFTMNQNKMGKLMRNVGSFDSKEDGNKIFKKFVKWELFLHQTF